jgi:hypothetical protein
MSTLATLRAACRKVLASTDDSPDGTLDAFIQDAIRFHSATFPRRWRHTITLATGTQAYAVPGAHGFLGILSVECPTGQTPQSFLEEVAEWSDRFQNKEDVYAVRGISDSTAIESDTAAATIVFAETVSTGQTAVVEYLGLHAVPTAADDDAQITVPDWQWEALVAFVDFRAHWELETDEAATLANVTLMLSQLGEDGRRAWNRYKEVVNALLLQTAKSVTIDWTAGEETMRRAY